MRDNFKGVWIPRQHCSFFPRTTSIKISLYLRNLVPSTARHSTAGTWTESRSHKTRPLPSAAPAPPVNPDAAFPPRWPGVSGPGCPRQSRAEQSRADTAAEHGPQALLWAGPGPAGPLCSARWVSAQQREQHVSCRGFIPNHLPTSETFCAPLICVTSLSGEIRSSFSTFF